MKDTLQPGLTHTFRFTIPETKTVPHLFPESDMFREMPAVLATGFMVGLMEWACIDRISVGRHERLVIDAARFHAKVRDKAARVASGS